MFDERQNQQGDEVERGAGRVEPANDRSSSREATADNSRDRQSTDQTTSSHRFGADELEQSLDARRQEEYGEVQ